MHAPFPTGLALALSLASVLSCRPQTGAPHPDAPPHAVILIPYEAGFASRFSLDGSAAEFQPFDAYRVDSDTPEGTDAADWIPGSEDLSFRTTLVLDADYLYFFTDVTDDDPRPPGDVYEAWMGDAWELYIGLYDLSREADIGSKRFDRSRGDWRLSFMPTGFFAQDGWLVQDIPGVESVVFPKFSGDGYLIEGRLELAALTAEGRGFQVYEGLRFPLKLDAKDQDRRKDADREASLSLGSAGIPAASRHNEDWKFPARWAVAQVVGAPERAPEAPPAAAGEAPRPAAHREPPVDLTPRAFTSLETALQSAEALLRTGSEGSAEGQYPPGSITELEAALRRASEALEDRPTGPRLAAAVSALYAACSVFESRVIAPAGKLVDGRANKQTRYLHANLKKGMANTFLFGMQHATGYGVGWRDDDDRSDVRDVCGDFPAIHGEDLREALQGGDLQTRLQYRIRKAYERGGVITLSWHQLDFDNRGWNSDRVGYENIVSQILPGGKRHRDYLAKLDLAADFFHSLRGKNGEAIPLIFRPFHEHYGSWFWWGVGQCTTEEFNRLWRFTVEYLRDEKQVHNLLWAISPDLKFLEDGADYFQRFPGDAYVDIYGVDFYYHVPLNTYVVRDYRRRLNHIVRIALAHDKIPALTEIGQDGLDDPDWHTRTMLHPLKYDSLNRHIAYGVTWRNEGTGHFHAPYPGHASVPDFLEFFRDPFTLFEKDLPDMYAAPDPAAGKPVDFPAPVPASGPGWHQGSFSENGWQQVKCPFGIDTAGIRPRAAGFAREFELPDKPAAARMLVRFSGGFILYINGTEAFRYNLPTGTPPEDGYPTPFTGNRNTKAVPFDDLMRDLLVAGKNRIAVAVHGGAAAAFFDARLETDQGTPFDFGSAWYRTNPRP